jgi:hypothetical protein
MRFAEEVSLKFTRGLQMNNKMTLREAVEHILESCRYEFDVSYDPCKECGMRHTCDIFFPTDLPKDMDKEIAALIIEEATLIDKELEKK